MIAPDTPPRNARPVAAERAPRDGAGRIAEQDEAAGAGEARDKADFETEMTAETEVEAILPQLPQLLPVAPAVVANAGALAVAEIPAADPVSFESEPAPPGREAAPEPAIVALDKEMEIPIAKGDGAPRALPEAAQARATGPVEAGARGEPAPELLLPEERPMPPVARDKMPRIDASTPLRPVTEAGMAMGRIDPGASDPASGGLVAPIARGAEWQLVAGQASRPAPGPAPMIEPRDLVGQITVALGRSEERKVEIRLDPPELGRVHIHLTQTEHGLRAMVIAERPETQELLRRNAEMLTADLGASGYDNVHLDFASGGQGQAAGQPPVRPGNFALEDMGPIAPEAVPAGRGVLRDTLDIRL